MSAEDAREYGERLIPILREGVGVIKMIFFKRLRDHLGEKYPDADPPRAGRLAGAVLNAVFGTPNPEESFVRFAMQNKRIIDDELNGLAAAFDDMRIPLTDALRVQFLCDSRAGAGDESTLARAKDLGVLVVDRDVPLPKDFLSLVRRLGAQHGLILPPVDLDNAGR